MASFRAMGTAVTVLAPALSERDEARCAGEVAALFERKEQRFSRFRSDSELSALNRARGPFVASGELFDALLRARRYHALTGGMFDPALGAALVALGYDRSFAPGALDRAQRPAEPPPRACFDQVKLEVATRTVHRPAHVLVDLGGMIKGRTADEAARLLPEPSVVDAGGDAVLRGAGPDGRAWLVDVEDPSDERRTLLTLRVCDRAVATSGTNRRRWRAGDVTAHHLLDPRTARPSRSDVAQATVLADDAELAEVLAKTALLLGRREGAAMLGAMARTSGVAAVLVTEAGDVVLIGELEVADA